MGKGGEGGTEEYEAGESGYNSGISSILAIGGGGGASHIYNKPQLLAKHEKNKIKYGGQNAKGLNGGSGGGSCCLQYENEKEGYSKGLSKELDKTYDYYSFGFNGGISYNIPNDTNNTDILLLRGGGGGGAKEDGENNYSIINNNYGKGGDGISIEDIDINMGP